MSQAALSDEAEIELMESTRAIRAGLEKLINGLHAAATGRRTSALFYPLGSGSDIRAATTAGKNLEWLTLLPPGVLEAVAETAHDGVNGPFNRIPSYPDAAHHGMTEYRETRIRGTVIPGVMAHYEVLDGEKNVIDTVFMIGSTPWLGFPVEGTLTGPLPEGLPEAFMGTYADFVVLATGQSAVETLHAAHCALIHVYTTVMVEMQKGNEVGHKIAEFPIAARILQRHEPQDQ